MPRPSRYSPEVRARAVRLVEAHTPENGSQWAAIAAIAPRSRAPERPSTIGSINRNTMPASGPGSRPRNSAA